mgnify:CR=1 FL=1
MLEEYMSIVTNMENYVDGILVLDKDAKIVYINQFRPDFTPLDEKRCIGKSLFEVYPTLDPKKSTLMKALKQGVVTKGCRGTLVTDEGTHFEIIDDSFPIIQNGEIIGAVDIATFPESNTINMPLEIYSEVPKPLKYLFRITDLIGRSPKMQQIRMQIQRISQTSSSVLIYGKTGTGKEMVAQSIHTSSDRKSKPFITQNCAAIPATLLESLFFGTTKGAYTGAENKSGIFEDADGGTIFLDEINSMDINLQAKLLRVLESKQISRVGSTESVSVDVRIIAATNQSPMQCIKDGTLRSDLFYRLGSVTIDLPTLQERPEDIELLTEYFISKYNTIMHKSIIGVSQDVMTIFKSYSWPGNVREFKNVIEGAFNLCEGTIIATSDLPSYIMSEVDLASILPDDDTFEGQIQWLGSLKNNMDAYEKALISKAIAAHPSLTAAADYLGITRQSLNQKLNKFEMKK